RHYSANGYVSASFCLAVCAGGAWSRSGGRNSVHFGFGQFGWGKWSLMYTPGRPSSNVSTGGGGCWYACLSGARDQTTRQWSPSVGAGTPGASFGNWKWWTLFAW